MCIAAAPVDPSGVREAAVLAGLTREYVRSVA
jgi:hypothetical protein